MAKEDRAWLDDRTLPGDSEERLMFALNLREGVEPEGAIADWGDYDGDYTDQQHDEAYYQPPKSGDVRSMSFKQVQEFYNLHRPSGVTVRNFKVIEGGKQDADSDRNETD